MTDERLSTRIVFFMELKKLEPVKRIRNDKSVAACYGAAVLGDDPISYFL